MTASEADQATLVALFRTWIEAQSTHQKSDARFAANLGHLRTLILDGWGSPDAQFPQQVFEDHGPAPLLRAMAEAYEQPDHVMDELKGD